MTRYSILQRRADAEQPTNHKPTFDSLGQVFSSASAPIVEKHDTRLFMRHVLMNGDNVDLVFEQGPQDGLQLIFCDREVSINYGVVVAAREPRPRVYAHILADRDA